jgi:ABC-type Fe3+/spermidine/putrescine transport system ATPase subunit
LQKSLGITTVYVTHDQEEALSLSDRVAVMRDGAIEQTAPPKQLYEPPRTRFVADFVGVNNFITGLCRDVSDGRAVVDTPLGPVRALASDVVRPGARCVLAVRPENLIIGAAGGDNTFAATVTLASYLGNTLRYDVETLAGSLKVDVHDPWHHDVLGAGARITVGFPASAALALADE